MLPNKCWKEQNPKSKAELWPSLSTPMLNHNKQKACPLETVHKALSDLCQPEVTIIIRARKCIKEWPFQDQVYITLLIHRRTNEGEHCVNPKPTAGSRFCSVVRPIAMCGYGQYPSKETSIQALLSPLDTRFETSQGLISLVVLTSEILLALKLHTLCKIYGESYETKWANHSEQHQKVTLNTNWKASFP